MTQNQVGLITTLLLGIFILLGALIALTVKRKQKIVDFSIGLAFGVITTLLLTDLLPETFEALGLRKIYLFLIFSILGFTFLKVLDSFIPDHHDHKMNKKESNENLVHIGIVTTIALVLHNLIEGMAVYSTALSDSSLALALSIGVGFHNIPLGMVIMSSFYQSNNDKKKSIISIGLVSISTFVGGLIMYLFKLTSVNEVTLGIMLSVTLGMLIYIIIDELLPRMMHSKGRETSIWGAAAGIILVVLSVFFGG